MNFEARFWSKTQAAGECVEWTGCKSNGYGQIWWKGKMRGAHRMAYEITVGPIPEGLTIDHLCRNTLCVNPDHLDPCSQKENTLRGYGPTAMNARKTSCLRGHPFSDDNMSILVRANGIRVRVCRTCKREAMRRYRAN
jgi:hypothetical protein